MVIHVVAQNTFLDFLYIFFSNIVFVDTHHLHQVEHRFITMLPYVANVHLCTIVEMRVLLSEVLDKLQGHVINVIRVER